MDDTNRGERFCCIALTWDWGFGNRDLFGAGTGVWKREDTARVDFVVTNEVATCKSKNDGGRQACVVRVIGVGATGARVIAFRRALHLKGTLCTSSCGKTAGELSSEAEFAFLHVE